MKDTRQAEQHLQRLGEQKARHLARMLELRQEQATATVARVRVIDGELRQLAGVVRDVDVQLEQARVALADAKGGERG